MLFCHATESDVTAVKEILDLFGRASGLKVNYAKSSATVLHGDQTAHEMIASLACATAALPVTYLGIPLTTRCPSAGQLQPLVDKVTGHLPTWKAWLMNRAGRLALVKSVLRAIPVHQLLAFAPPKKTLQQLAKIQRGFFWAGRAAANGGHCHVNWRHVTRPLALGGLGVRGLERAGLALRLRWLWLSRLARFGPPVFQRTLFFASTYMSIGNGTNALFWEDRWLNGRSVGELMPLLYNCIPTRRRKGRTVAEGLNGDTWARDIQGVLGIHEIGQYLQLWQLAQQVTSA
uniref:Reverse transcriptase domain-containing protein n=1 Tax=Aegilops tauschii subsp. strangulata TaxID=200361 RepID=A0A453RUT0_AEGTS